MIVRICVAFNQNKDLTLSDMNPLVTDPYDEGLPHSISGFLLYPSACPIPLASVAGWYVPSSRHSA